MVTPVPPSLDAWNRRVISVEQHIRGVNNQTLLLTTDAGPMVLRLYRTNDLERIDHEHRLLVELRRLPLPFSTPEPRSTSSGTTTPRVPWRGRSVVAALFPLLPGNRPADGSLVQAEACGRAIGQLHVAMARLPAAVVQRTACPRIDSIDPIVRSPVAAAAAIGDDRATGARLAQAVERVMINDDAFQRGRMDVIHGDPFGGNFLVAGDEVSAVLDFECAGVGPAMMDLAVATLSLCLTPSARADRWRLTARLAAGYAGVRRLSAADLQSIPSMLRRREVVSFVDRIGRHRRGEISTGDLHERAARLIELDRWLDAESDRLVATMGARKSAGA